MSKKPPVDLSEKNAGMAIIMHVLESCGPQTKAQLFKAYQRHTRGRFLNGNPFGYRFEDIDKRLQWCLENKYVSVEERQSARYFRLTHRGGQALERFRQFAYVLEEIICRYWEP